MSFPLRVKETTGALREIVLKGRSLPYQGASWGGEQRVNLSWFPGNPVAVAQVIGAIYLPTTFNGTWKDVFLGGRFGATSFPDAAQISNFPPLGPALNAPEGLRLNRAAPTFDSGGAQGISQPSGTLGVTVKRARILRDAFEAIRLGGQQLKVQWGSITRFGFLIRTDFPHDREEDIGWELEFAWIGETDGQPEIEERPDESLNFLGKLRALLQLMSDLLNKAFAALQNAAMELLAITQAVRKIGSLVDSLGDIYKRLAQFVFFPADLIQEARGILTDLRLTIGDLLRETGRIPAAYSNALDPIEKNVATGIQQAIAFAAKKLGVEASTQSRDLDAAADPDLLGTVVSDGSTTLRDYSTQFYGTPDNWTRIASYNSLNTSLPGRGLVIYIPRI